MPKKEKRRIDRLLVDKGLAESREKAQALLMAGRVEVNGVIVDKAGKEVPLLASVIVKGGLPYVSRGGIKLEGALDEFGLNVNGLIALDVGASTGGFTDCLLKKGARKVFAVDVGVGLIDVKLRNDKRVCLLEKQNIRYLEPDKLSEPIDIAIIDISFISLEKALPKVLELIKKDGYILALIKPQFEVGKGEVGKGGIVRDPKKHKMVLERLKTFSQGLGLNVTGTSESPIKGAKGNKEFWMYLRIARTVYL